MPENKTHRRGFFKGLMSIGIGGVAVSQLSAAPEKSAKKSKNESLTPSIRIKAASGTVSFTEEKH